MAYPLFSKTKQTSITDISNKLSNVKSIFESMTNKLSEVVYESRELLAIKYDEISALNQEVEDINAVLRDTTNFLNNLNNLIGK